MYDIPFISMTAINRELQTTTLNGVDVTANDVEIPTFRPTIADPKVLTSRRQDQHLIDTDKLNSVTDL